MLKSKGFTLVEVLVAATILFSCIVAVTLLFRSSYLASEKARLRIEQTAVLPSLLQLVQDEIRATTNASASKLTGEGVIWAFPYQWSANLLEFKPPVDKFDAISGTIDKYPNKYQLWKVSLVLGSGKTALEYQFNEFSWVEQ